MAIVTEVGFAHEHGALADTLNALTTVDVSVVREAATDPDQDVYVFRFDNADDVDLRAVLESDHTVKRVDSMEQFDEELWGVVFAEGTELIAPLVTSHDGFVLEARSSSADDDLRGWHERWMLPDRQALQDIWRTARDRGFRFDVFEFRNRDTGELDHPGPYVLTAAQREALVIARERGYFEEPRETSLEELASELDVSASAVGARLRRGMNALIGMSLISGEDLEERTDR